MAETSFTFVVPSAVASSLEAAAEADSLRHGLKHQARWQRGRRSSLMILRVKGEPEAIAQLKADLERFIGALPMDIGRTPPSRAARAAISFATGLGGVLGALLLARACG